MGSVTDTYNLSVQGALLEAASIQSTAGPIAAGLSSQIPITLKPVNFASPGNYTLQIQAVSQTNPSVMAYATATVQVPGSKSVSAAITPSPASVSALPGSATLLFQVTNTGNVPDNYTAAITSASSNVTATLNGSGQSIAAFPVPALATSGYPLAATLNSGSSGTVTVTVTSTSNASETAQATVTIGQATTSPCDVNQDGKTNVLDVQMMINEALGADTPGNDLTGDKFVNVVDIQIDVNAALNLGCSASTQAQSVAKPQSHVRTLLVSSPARVDPVAIARPARIVDLGTLGGKSTTAYGMNNLGQVVGISDTAQAESHAFLWEAGQMTDLSVARDANLTVAYGINDAGQVAGVFTNPDRDPHGTLRAINNAGELAGDLPAAAGSSPKAFSWNAGKVIDLGTLGGSESHARAVNDSGQVAGFANLEGNGAIHAFLYSGSGLTDLGTLGGQNSMAFSIDAAGEVAGASEISGSGVRHAFLYRGGAMLDLGTLGGTESHADGINDSGWIVGWSYVASGEQHAFLWHSGRMVDLNSIVTPAAGVWLSAATAINHAGQITANASNGHAYLIALPMESH